MSSRSHGVVHAQPPAFLIFGHITQIKIVHVLLLCVTLRCEYILHHLQF
jgi:hypothetical protein